MKMAISAKSPVAITTDAPKESYPYVCFRDKQVDKLETSLGEMPEVGDEVTVTMTLKCTALRKDENGKSADFNVVSVAGGETSEAEDEGDDEKEEAPMADMKGVKNPALKKGMAKMMEGKKY
jgi:hypothetical protein